jgi:hypothetical protein
MCKLTKSHEGEDSRELFQVFLCELSFTAASRNLIHSGDPVSKKILLFAGEWPNQLKASDDALDLCTSLLLKTLVPYPADADVEIWRAVDNLLTALPSTDTAEAREGVLTIATNYAIKYAKEHPYLLGVNVALAVVGLVPAVVTGPFLGVLGFSSAGVRAGWSHLVSALNMPDGNNG